MVDLGKKSVGVLSAENHLEGLLSAGCRHRESLLGMRVARDVNELACNCDVVDVIRSNPAGEKVAQHTFGSIIRVR